MTAPVATEGRPARSRCAIRPQIGKRSTRRATSHFPRAIRPPMWRAGGTDRGRFARTVGRRASPESTGSFVMRPAWARLTSVAAQPEAGPAGGRQSRVARTRQRRSAPAAIRRFLPPDRLQSRILPAVRGTSPGSERSTCRFAGICPTRDRMPGRACAAAPHPQPLEPPFRIGNECRIGAPASRRSTANHLRSYRVFDPLRSLAAFALRVAYGARMRSGTALLSPWSVNCLLPPRVLSFVPCRVTSCG